MERVNGKHGWRLQVEMDWRQAIYSIFSDLIIERAAGSITSERWNVAPGRLPRLPGTVLVHHQHPGCTNDEWLLDFPPSGFAFVEQEGESVHVRVAADSDIGAARILALLHDAIPVCAPRASAVRVTFWRHSRHGYFEPVTKHLQAPTWPEIAPNYPIATERFIAPLLVEGWRPQGGRLLLWHGEPGTGKSFAVRALMQAWKAWCGFHVIVDPERFFGDGADYMMTVLLERADDEPAHGAPGAAWRLLILEDTGELLAVDAKDRQGQGLSRLLNVCDGLLGQSLNILMLITTNEDLGRLHPAVIRPGRCLANLAFQRFDASSARRWCVEHGVTPAAPPPHAPTLADLFALRDGRTVTRRQSAAGFLSA
jgi:ATPase family protein associated with various cellular activities (AAA)